MRSSILTRMTLNVLNLTVSRTLKTKHMKGMREIMIKANSFITKIVILGILFSIMMTTYVMAENINGIEFDIPEAWELANSETVNNTVQNIYTYDNEIIVINIEDNSSLDDDMKILCDLTLLDCDSIYGEYEGYYLMTDESFKSDENYLNKLQECVFFDENSKWTYVYMASGNTGNANISILYCSPTIINHTQLEEAKALVNVYLPVIQ